MIRQTIAGCILACFCCLQLSAQRVTMQLAKRSIVLGEQVALQLTVQVPSAHALPIANWWVLPDSIAHCEILGKLPIDTISVKDNALIYRQVIWVTSFDSGYWTLPACSLKLANGQILTTDTIGLQVLPVPVGKLTTFNSIKDILTINQSDTSSLWLAIGGGIVLLLLVIGGYLYYQRKPKYHNQNEQEPLTEQQLLQALNQLPTLLQKGAYAKMMERLVPIVGQLVSLKLGIHTKAVTTAEWELQIAPHMVHRSSWQAYLQVLQIANLVKFAQYEPSEQECVFALDAARQLLVHIPSPVSNTAHVV